MFFLFLPFRFEEMLPRLVAVKFEEGPWANTIRIGKTDWIFDADAGVSTAAEWDFDEITPMLWPDNATAILSGETVETIGENAFDVLVIEFAGM